MIYVDTSRSRAVAVTLLISVSVWVRHGRSSDFAMSTRMSEDVEASRVSGHDTQEENSCAIFMAASRLTAAAVLMFVAVRMWHCGAGRVPVTRYACSSDSAPCHAVSACAQRLGSTSAPQGSTGMSIGIRTWAGSP